MNPATRWAIAVLAGLLVLALLAYARGEQQRGVDQTVDAAAATVVT